MIAHIPHLRSSRRAFTLLEVVLASLISAIVLAGALSLYFFVDGADRRMQRRFEDTANLQRIHLVMERICTTFVMADRTQVRAGAAPATAAEAAISAAGADLNAPKTATGSSSGSASGSKTTASSSSSTTEGSGSKSASGGSGKSGSKNEPDNRPGANLPRVPPRIMLEVDPTHADEAQAIARMATGVSEGPSARRAMTQPQRFEVALSASPVPNTVSTATLEAARRAASSTPEDSTSSSRPESQRNFGTRSSDDPLNSTDEEDAGSTRVIRGALELRPQRTESRVMDSQLPDQLLWELWWVPLAPRRDTSDSAPPPAPLGEGYRVATDIAFMQIRAFDDQSRKTSYQAAFMQDIPAYIEVEVETARGLTANWLFEVTWSIGNELPPETAPSGDSSTEAKGSAGKDGGAKGSGGKGGTTPTSDKGGGK